MPDVRHVQIGFDGDAQVWWAESDEVPGLVSEAPTKGELLDRVAAVAPELLAANGDQASRVVLRFVMIHPVPDGLQDHTQFA